MKLYFQATLLVCLAARVPKMEYRSETACRCVTTGEALFMGLSGERMNLYCYDFRRFSSPAET